MTEYCSGFRLYGIVKICWEYYDSPYLQDHVDFECVFCECGKLAFLRIKSLCYHKEAFKSLQTAAPEQNRFKYVAILSNTWFSWNTFNFGSNFCFFLLLFTFTLFLRLILWISKTFNSNHFQNEFGVGLI